MYVIKAIVFQILLSLRRIILGVSKLLSLTFLGSFCIMIIFTDLHRIPLTAKLMALGLGVIFTFIYWFYDYLVFNFKPNYIDLVLYKQYGIKNIWAGIYLPRIQHHQINPLSANE
jgi:hypothetical protein